MRKSIAIDMDQVIANMYKKMAVSYNELFGTAFTEEELLRAPKDSMTREEFDAFINEYCQKIRSDNF